MKKIFLALVVLLGGIGAQAQEVKADFTSQEARNVYFRDDFENGLSQWKIDTTNTERTWYTLFAEQAYKEINPWSNNRLYCYGSKNNPSHETILTQLDVLPHSVLGFWVSVALDDNHTAQLLAVSGEDTLTLLDFREALTRNADYTAKQYRRFDVPLDALTGETVQLGFRYEGTAATAYSIAVEDVEVYQRDIEGLTANVYLGEPVHFRNLSTGENSTYTWEFPGGEPATSSEADPVVTYTEPGSYAVRLTTTSNKQSDTKSVEGYVTATYNVPIAKASPLYEGGYNTFTACRLFVAPGDNFTIRDASLGYPTAWKWQIVQGTDTVLTRYEQHLTAHLDTVQQKTSSIQYTYILTASNPAGEHQQKYSSNLFVDGTQLVWNVNSDEKPDHPSGYYVDPSNHEMGFIGSNDAGITAWAERFEAPARPACINRMGLVFPDITTGERFKLTVGIYTVGADGKPGQELFTRSLTTLTRTAPTSVWSSTNTKWTNIDMASEPVLINEPFFVVVSGIPEYKGGKNTIQLAAVPHATEEQGTAYALQNGRWRRFGHYSLACIPSISYLKTNVDDALDNSFRADFETEQGGNAVLYEGQEIRFRNLSRGLNLTYSWQFPGGLPETSNVANPEVVYPAAGRYDAQLTISDGQRDDTYTLRNAVVVSEMPVQADFAAQEAQRLIFHEDFEGKTLEQWTITGQAPGTSSAWRTLFADAPYKLIEPATTQRLFVQGFRDKGSDETILSQMLDVPTNAEVSFYTSLVLDDGYTASLIAVTDEGDTLTLVDLNQWRTALPDYVKSNWYLVTADLSQLAERYVRIGFTFRGEGSSSSRVSIEDFRLYQTGEGIQAAALRGGTVHFRNHSLGKGDLSYLWTFVGGEPSTSTESEPVVTYSELGSFPVSLTVTDGLGRQHTRTLADYVSVTPKTPTALVDFPTNIYYTRSAGNIFVPQGKPFTLTDASTDYPTQWQWSVKNAEGEVVQTSEEPSITLQFDTLLTGTVSAFYSYVFTARNEGGETSYASGSQEIKVGGSSPIWNIARQEKPSSVSVNRFSDDNPSQGYLGGATTEGVTAWAERFVAPLDTAVISNIFIQFGKAKTYARGTRITVSIHRVAPDGSPGEALEFTELDKGAADLTESLRSLSTAWTKFAYDEKYPVLILPEPYFVVVEGFKPYEEGSNEVAMASFVREGEDARNTTWMLQNGEWKPAPCPMSLYVSPWLSYADKDVKPAIALSMQHPTDSTPSPSATAIYDLVGRRLQRQQQRGIVIQRHADGTITKQLMR